MGSLKKNCIYLPQENKGFSLAGVQPDWDNHPSWIAGIEALNAYNHWVCEVVLPIAFQWIEEHESEVYGNVPKKLQDDVGVVIAAAFELVKTKPYYKAGLKGYAQYQVALKNGKWDPKKVNQTWQKIAKKVRKETKDAFNAEKALLDGTIR